MSLDAWRTSRLMVEHEPSRQEILELLGIVRTDFEDIHIPQVSADQRLACCPSALLTAARAALRAAGYRVSKTSPSHLYDAIPSLRFTVGLEDRVLRQMESMGKKRVTADYVRVGEVSESMVEEGLALAEEHCERIIDWIRTAHPSLIEESV